MARPLRPVLAAVVLALVAPVPRLAAQSASALLAQGVLAYQKLDYDLAVRALRASLSRDPPATLADSERVRALVYLAATELFRSQRDSAAATLRALVQLNPRYRPDELIFPPLVTNLFEDVRRSTKVLAISVPPQTTLKARAGWFTTRVIASPAQSLRVTLARADGTPVRALYDGSVADSLVVKWDGLTGQGALPDAGRYVMRVEPNPSTGDGPRPLEVTLDITHVVPDTLLWPAAPAAPATPAPERRSAAPALGAVGATALAGGTVVVLPSLFGRSADATGARFVVAALVGIAGIVGIVAHRAPPTEADQRANDPAWKAWRERVTALEAENAKTRAGVALSIRAGPAVVADRRVP